MPGPGFNSAPTRASPHQHEVDIESEDLPAHVNAVGMREVLAQVGKGTCCALEVSAGDLHALGENRGGCQKQSRRAAGVHSTGRIHTLEADNTQHPSLVLSYDPPTAPTLLTSSDMRLSMAPSMECSAPGEAQNTGSGLAWGCRCHP